MIDLILFSRKEKAVKMNAFVKKTSFVGFIFAFTFCHQALSSEHVIGSGAFLKAYEEEIKKTSWKKKFHNTGFMTL